LGYILLTECIGVSSTTCTLIGPESYQIRQNTAI